MDVKLKCSCGSVKGTLSNATPEGGNRIVCCCDDCQQFATYLSRGDDVLDQFGGTEIFQVSQSQIRIHQGAQHLRALRLTQNGLTRWYTDCCKSPVANTVNAKLPFAGVVHSFILTKGKKDKLLGPVTAYVQTRHAIGTPDYPHSAKKFPVSLLLKTAMKILKWKSRGMEKPTVFFDDEGEPTVKPIIVNP